jgi:hypothetical protein
MLWIIQLGGAIADHDTTATSFGNRDADAIFAANGAWPPDAPDDENDQAWARTA